MTVMVVNASVFVLRFSAGPHSVVSPSIVGHGACQSILYDHMSNDQLGLNVIGFVCQ